jgi:hypothetical protein
MAVIVYRTQDGLTNYGFSIDFQPDIGWRVYIIFRPVRQGLDDSQSLPYQAIDHEGRRYVDWSEKLDNLGDARTVATFWAELIQDYHRAQVKKRSMTSWSSVTGAPRNEKRSSQLTQIVSAPTPPTSVWQAPDVRTVAP